MDITGVTFTSTQYYCFPYAFHVCFTIYIAKPRLGSLGMCDGRRALLFGLISECDKLITHEIERLTSSNEFIPLYTFTMSSKRPQDTKLTVQETTSQTP
jgi:hypothetical protein